MVTPSNQKSSGGQMTYQLLSTPFLDRSFLAQLLSTLRPSIIFYAVNEQITQQLQALLPRFWVQEEIPASKVNALTSEEEECEAYFRQTHRRKS